MIFHNSERTTLIVTHDSEIIKLEYMYHCFPQNSEAKVRELETKKNQHFLKTVAEIQHFFSTHIKTKHFWRSVQTLILLHTWNINTIHWKTLNILCPYLPMPLWRPLSWNPAIFMPTGLTHLSSKFTWWLDVPMNHTDTNMIFVRLRDNALTHANQVQTITGKCRKVLSMTKSDF